MASSSENKAAKLNALMEEAEAKGMDLEPVINNFNVGQSSRRDSSPVVVAASAKSGSVCGDDGSDVVTGNPLAIVKVEKRKTHLDSQMAEAEKTPPSKKPKTGKAPAVRKSSRTNKKKEEVIIELDDESDGTKVIDTSSRSIVPEMTLRKEVLEEVGLEAVQNLLIAQDWGKLIQEEVTVNSSLVRQFYSELKIEKQGNSWLGTFMIDGEKGVFTSKLLAGLLKVPHRGCTEYVKGRWPSHIAKDVILRRVGPDVNTMGIVCRVLHKLVTQNITPRMQKHTDILYQDYLLIDKLLRREHINLPAQIMQHMKHVRKQQNHGLPYPGIVKRILSSMSDYDPEGEELLSIDFEEKTILDWKFENVPAVGWHKESEFEATLEGIVDDERELFEEQLNNLKKNIAFMVANVAGDLNPVEIALDLAQEQIIRGRAELHSLREKLRDIALSAVKDVKDIFPPGTSQN